MIKIPNNKKTNTKAINFIGSILFNESADRQHLLYDGKI